MKKTALALIFAATIPNVMFASTVCAAGPDGMPEQHHQQESRPGADRQNMPERNHSHAAHQSRDEHREPSRENGGHRSEQRRHSSTDDHFAFNGHDFRKGRAAPRDFRGGQYRVDNWHQRGLPAPPAGHHWAYIDGHYILIAAATGIITSILIGSMAGQ